MYGIGDPVKVVLYGVATSKGGGFVTVETDWGNEYEIDAEEAQITLDDD